MGSFVWDNTGYVQYHNGRPLSVALVEPCKCEGSSCVEGDFALQYRPRSRSSGRKIQRESYRVYRPNVQYASFSYSPPFPRRTMDFSDSRDFFVEKLETVTIEEEQCRPNYRCVSYVRAPSPPVRQVKIRSRPSSCFDLRKKEETDNQWTKVVEERHDEHYNYHYNYTLPTQRTVSVERELFPKIIRDSATTIKTEDFDIPITSKTVRPSTRDASTTTAGLPRRPLSISETQVLDRYEKEEKIRRESITDTSSYNDPLTSTTTHRSLQRSYNDDKNDSDDKQYKPYISKLHRKEFLQRMHTRNGTSWRPYNSLSLYTDRGRNQVIVRPTSKPREALVDTPAIIDPASEPDLPKPINYESTIRSKNYYQST